MYQEAIETFSMEHIDKQYYTKGFQHICGIDEAGRGPWAGPVYCAAVILPRNHGIKNLDDSKLLTEEQRESLYEQIVSKALTYSVVSVSNTKIDNMNILKATKYGMQQAIKKLSLTPHILLLDAVNIQVPEIPQVALIHGDGRSESIAAASILAKVERDRYMKKIDKKYPHYGFAKHKGYGTKQHQDALKELLDTVDDFLDPVRFDLLQG